MATIEKKQETESFTMCNELFGMMDKYKGTLFGDFLSQSFSGYSDFQKCNTLIMNDSIKFDSENKRFSIVKDKKKELTEILDSYFKFEKEELLPFLNSLGVDKNIFKKYEKANSSDFLTERGDLIDEAKFVLRLRNSISPSMDRYLGSIVSPNQNEVLESVDRIVKSYNNPFPNFKKLINENNYSEAANLLENTNTFLNLRSRQIVESLGLSANDFEKYLNGKYSGENKEAYDFLKSFVSLSKNLEGGSEANIDPDIRISKSFENTGNKSFYIDGKNTGNKSFYIDGNNTGNKSFKIKEVNRNSITSSGDSDFRRLFEGNQLIVSKNISTVPITNEFFIHCLTNNGGIGGTHLFFDKLSESVSVYENEKGLRFIEINNLNDFKETVDRFYSDPKNFKYVTLDQVAIGVLDQGNINYKEFELYLNGSFNTLSPDKIELYNNLSKLLVSEFGNASIYGFSESTLEWYTGDFGSLIVEWEEKYQKDFPGIDLSNVNLFIYLIERYNEDKLKITAEKNI